MWWWVYSFIGAAIAYRGAAGFHVFGTIFRMEGIGRGIHLNGFHERQLGKVPFRLATAETICSKYSALFFFNAFIGFSLWYYGTLTGSEPGYFIVHHRKNGRDMEAYLVCPKTAYSRTNHKNGSKQRMERDSNESRSNY